MEKSNSETSKSTATYITGKSAHRKVGRLLREVSDDEGSDVESVSGDRGPPNDPNKPWLPGFNAYMKNKDRLGGSTVIEWWGVSLLRLSYLLVPLISFQCSSILAALMFGQPLHGITSLSWLRRSQVNVLSQRLG